MDTESRRDDWFARFGWAIVLTATLSMSAYSLFYVGRHLGMPWYFAAIVSLCFDGVAVLAADYSLRYARMGLTATGPQLTVFIFGGLSAYLNTLHAYFGHEIPMAKVLWAAPPVAAILVFEFHTKWERLSALRSAGRIAEALPPLGRHSWMHHPFASLRVIRAISGERLTEVVEREAPRYVAELKRTREVAEAEAQAEREAMTLETAATQADAVRIALAALPESASTNDVVRYLADARPRSWSVSSARVRQVRSAQARTDAESRRRELRMLPPASGSAL